MSTKVDLFELVLITLRRITRAIDLHSRELVRNYNLTGPQLVLLKELARFNEITVGDLSKKISLSNATVTDILDRLERRKLVERTRSSSDRRCVMVKVTDQGRELLYKAPPLLQERFKSQFDCLKEWEQTLILSSLQRVAKMMEAKDLDAAPWLVSETMADFDVNPELAAESDSFFKNDESEMDKNEIKTHTN